MSSNSNVQQCRFNAGTPAQCKNRVDLRKSGGVATCSFHRNFTGNSGKNSNGVSLATLQTMSRLQPTRFNSVVRNGMNAMNAYPKLTQYVHGNHSVVMTGYIKGDRLKWNGQYVDLPYEDDRVKINWGHLNGNDPGKLSVIFTDKKAEARSNQGDTNAVCDSLYKRMAIDTTNSYYEEAVGSRFGYLNGTSTAEVYAGGVPQIIAQMELGEYQHCQVTVSRADEEDRRRGVCEHVRFEYPDGDDFSAEILYQSPMMTDLGEFSARWKIANPVRVNGEPLTEDQQELFETVGAVRQLIGKYSINREDESVLMPPGWTEREADSFDLQDRFAG